MKPWVYGIILPFLVPLQASLLGPLSLGGIAPDLGLAVLYCIGLLTGPVEAAFAGTALGLLQDIGSANLIGFSGLTHGFAGLLAGFLGRRVMDIRDPSNLVLIALFSLAESVFAALFLETLYGSVPFFGLFFGRMLPRALTTAVAGYGILRLATSKRSLALITRREIQKEH